MKIEIICNEKGTGKTTFALKNYIPHKYFVGDKAYKFEDHSDLKNTYCIIDSVNSIPIPLFNSSMETIVSREWKAIILIFDIEKTHLMECPNFNMIWECGMLPRNYSYSNFIASQECFYDYFHFYYPELSEELYDNIIKISEHNFKKIDRLLLLNQIHADNTSEIDGKALAKYVDEIIRIKYKDIPNADILLQKASIIGEKFVCDVLESPIGFGCEAASDYLKQMDEMHGFIRSCINVNSTYEFISHDIYQGIFNSISNENKTTWIKVIIQYYKNEYKRCFDSIKQFSILNTLKNLYKILPKYYNIERKALCFLLFYRYRNSNQTYKALEIAKEITKDLTSVTSVTEQAYVQAYQIKTLIQLGEYKQVLKILKELLNAETYLGSKIYIKYYYAYSLFQTGNIDLSYKITVEIINYLKDTSGSNRHSQGLYCMAYSLMATLQNHIGLDDEGIRYFHLALNKASSNLNNKKYFYNILKKCDMFYEYKEIKLNLCKCLNYYEQNRDWNLAGEVCVNLATEILFQDCINPKEVSQYFEKAVSYFSEQNNEKLAYAKNNYGIYIIMVENNIKKGLSLFKEALLVGLTDFTYMSIYLNICMCYILLNKIESSEFEDAYARFLFAKGKLNHRQHSSKYENIYYEILDIIIKEYLGNDVKISCQKVLNTVSANSFFAPLLNDIIERKQQKETFYNNNSFFYMRMNQLRCFFAEFRFWE